MTVLSTGVAAIPHSRPVSKRDRIIETASAVFAREGFAGSSIDLIAAEAGVSRQTVYNQFGDKEAVFAAIVADTTERANASLFAALASFPDKPGDLETDLVDFARRLVTSCFCDRRSAALVRIVEAEAQRYPELFRAWREEGPGRLWAAISYRLIRLRDAGLLDVEDTDLAARQFISLAVMDLKPAMVVGLSPTTAEVDAATRAAVRTFLRAYGTSRPTAKASPTRKATPLPAAPARLRPARKH
jgi:AcrR family transcriptional regulator